MEEFKKYLRLDIIVTVLSVVGMVISWYFSTNQTNQLQNDKINQIFSIIQNHDNRITAVEQKQNNVETQTAVIKVQLDSIQSDLKDIKAELKKK